VEHRLPVRHDQIGVPATQLLDRLPGDVRKRLPDPGVQPAHLLHRRTCWRQRSGDGGAQLLRIGLTQKPERRQHQLVAVQVKIRRGGVDGVVRRPGHQADDSHVSPTTPIGRP
jgi:hypothetical protein